MRSDGWWDAGLDAEAAAGIKRQILKEMLLQRFARRRGAKTAPGR
jgi:hypothetical protein